jgi:ATP phosphoribosyltransferase regulatory subunit HisZ
VLWIAEGRGESVAAGDKVAFSSARLVSQVGTLTQIIAVQWAAECAKRVLRHYEDRYPEDKRPREAIQAALKWAKDPTEANRDAAYAAAAYAAASAAYATYATNAAYAAYAAAAADAAAASAAYAADAAYAAAAYAAASAAASAAYADADDARKKEREWQSDRLLKLLGAL